MWNRNAQGHADAPVYQRHRMRLSPEPPKAIRKLSDVQVIHPSLRDPKPTTVPGIQARNSEVDSDHEYEDDDEYSSDDMFDGNSPTVQAQFQRKESRIANHARSQPTSAQIKQVLNNPNIPQKPVNAALAALYHRASKKPRAPLPTVLPSVLPTGLPTGASAVHLHSLAAPIVGYNAAGRALYINKWGKQCVKPKPGAERKESGLHQGELHEDELRQIRINYDNHPLQTFQNTNTGSLRTITNGDGSTKKVLYKNIRMSNVEFGRLVALRKKNGRHVPTPKVRDAQDQNAWEAKNKTASALFEARQQAKWKRTRPGFENFVKKSVGGDVAAGDVGMDEADKEDTFDSDTVMSDDVN